MKQVTASKEKLSRLEQDREQLVVDLQLLSIKYEKEQKVRHGGSLILCPMAIIVLILINCKKIVRWRLVKFEALYVALMLFC